MVPYRPATDGNQALLSLEQGLLTRGDGPVADLPVEKHEYGHREYALMSEQAEWMQPEDDHLLALLRTGRKDTFSAIAGQLPLSREQVAQRCRTLAAHGLVDHLGSDIYTISPLGRRYLDGEVDAEELRG